MLEPLLARLSCCFVLFYAVFNSKRNLSAIIAINSELVGFPLLADIVYPNMFSTASCWPLPHATSIAWRIALSTRLGVVQYLLAISGYKLLLFDLLHLCRLLPLLWLLLNIDILLCVLVLLLRV